MRILYVVHAFPPEAWAGTEVYTLNLARAVAAQGHEVTVLARGEVHGEELELREEEVQGLRVLRLALRSELPELPRPYERPEVDACFEALLAHERPDVVHFQHLLHLSTGLIDVTRRAGIPTVMTLNDYWALCPRVQLIRPDGERCERNRGLACLWCLQEKHLDRIDLGERLLPWIAPLLGLAGEVLHTLRLSRKIAPEPGERERLAYSLSRRSRALLDLRYRHESLLERLADVDLLVAPSRFLRERFLESGRLDPLRFVHSDYGTCTEHLHGMASEPAPREGGPLRVGFVGSLLWYKGIDVLIEAVARLAGRELSLEVHGAFEPEADPFHAKLRRLAAGAPVTFHGRFANDRLAEVYAGIDVLVVPSVWFENSPLTIHEAFLLHTPLVVSDIGGMAELVEPERSGLHFRAGDAVSLASALERLLDEPELLQHLREGIPAVKTIEEDARETVDRYRALGAGKETRTAENAPPGSS